MAPHPVQLHVEPAPQMARAQVVTRLVLLVALGTLGCSSVYWVFYLALPALAAMRVAQKIAQAYLIEDGPRLARLLQWLASVYAYLWLLTDALPSSESGPVKLVLHPSGAPTPSSALLRLLTSLPALLVLTVLSIVASLLWPVGAVMILVRRRLPAVLVEFFLMKLRGQFRLIAYHLSLVDRYPSFEEGLATGEAAPSGNDLTRPGASLT
jgi:hypothetical protein